MAQINTIVGDFAYNTKRILEAMAEAKSLWVNLLTFPELAVCGYPPEDLLFKPQFIVENRRSLERIIEQSSGLAAVVGFIDSQNGDIFSAAAIINDLERS